MLYRKNLRQQLHALIDERIGALEALAQHLGVVSNLSAINWIEQIALLFLHIPVGKGVLVFGSLKVIRIDSAIVHGSQNTVIEGREFRIH